MTKMCDGCAAEPAKHTLDAGTLHLCNDCLDTPVLPSAYEGLYPASKDDDGYDF